MLRFLGPDGKTAVVLGSRSEDAADQTSMH